MLWKKRNSFLFNYFLVCLEGFEPPISKFVALHSIQLNYRHIYFFIIQLFITFFKYFINFFDFFIKNS